MSVTLGIRLERLDASTAALADVLPRAKAEDSCLHLEVCRMVIDPTVFVLWEGWSDLVKYRDDEFLNTRTCSPSSWRRSRWRVQPSTSAASSRSDGIDRNCPPAAASRAAAANVVCVSSATRPVPVRQSASQRLRTN
jgi:hypothetical protein